MLRTLVLDDNTSLIDSLQILARREGIEGAAFFTSLADARRATQKSVFDRYVADQVLEGEDGDGLTFLEEVSENRPGAELVLFTGKPLTKGTETRLERINASVLEKASASLAAVQSLLSEPRVAENVEVPKEEVDIAELRIKIANLNSEVVQLRNLNDLLVEDIIEELDRMPDAEKKMLAVGPHRYSPEDLKREVRRKTPLGRQLIRLHHELYRRLRS